MNLYETVIIFKSTGYEKSAKVFRDMCQKFSGKFKINDEKMGVKKLAYDITSFTEGYYEMFTWAGSPDNVSELEKYMRIDDNVLKFITIKRDEAPKDKLKIYDPKSEQTDYNPNSQVDAIDVLLGFADYTK